LRFGYSIAKRLCVVVCVITTLFTIATERVEGLTLGLEPDMGVERQHLWRYMPRNGHDSLVAGRRLSKLSDGVMPKVMETESRG